MCHSDDFVLCGFAASDEVDRVLMTPFDTKILPRMRPTPSERTHLGRTIRWGPQRFELESNNKHVEDMVELCRLKLDTKRTSTPITKATEKERND